MQEMEDALRTIGHKLATARRAETNLRQIATVQAISAADVGISQRRIAELLGVDRMTVRKWIGKR